MHIFDVIIFFELRTIQQKTVKPTYLSVRCQEADGSSKKITTSKICTFCPVQSFKKRSSNLLCVLILNCLQHTFLSNHALTIKSYQNVSKSYSMIPQHPTHYFRQA